MTTPASNVPELAPVSQPPLDVIVLAAGQGTRMRSALPKVLHPVMGRPMVSWAVKRARELGARDVVVVTGHGADRVEAALAGDGVRFARQDRQLGTGHAFLVGARTLAGDGDVLVLYGDTPLLTPETLRALLNDHRERGSALTVLTGELEDATGYGRILRDADGSVSRIVEEKAATPDEKRVREFNSGVYLMNRRAPELAERITDDNAAGEYYLTDLLALYRAEGARVSAFRLADADEVMGANDRVQLAQAEAIMRRRLAEGFMRAGVTLIDPATTYIEDSVELAQDCVLEPGVILRGQTRVARGATIGAYSVVTDSTVAEDAEIKPHSVLEDVTVGPRSHVGPFARLRGGAVLAEDVHVGNFVEIKNSTLARGVKAGHLAYLGDAEVGEDSNIGAGTITANFDGVDKHRTRIGRGVFIGSNSTLIAPRTLGDAAYVAAGSTVHDDVAEGALAVARGRQRNVEGWSLRNWRRVSERLQGRNVFLTTWLDAQRSRSE